MVNKRNKQKPPNALKGTNIHNYTISMVCCSVIFNMYIVGSLQTEICTIGCGVWQIPNLAVHPNLGFKKTHQGYVGALHH